jgi:hypothetical protein
MNDVERNSRFAGIVITCMRFILAIYMCFPMERSDVYFNVIVYSVLIFLASGQLRFQYTAASSPWGFCFPLLLNSFMIHHMVKGARKTLPVATF